VKRSSQYHFETYPGLEHFRDDDVSRKLYYGRDVEKQALLDLVIAESLAVLFSRSGLGKSSLINAGLKQPLRERGYFPVSARVTLAEKPVRSVISSILMEAMLARVEVRGGDDTSSLWQFLNTARFERDGAALKLVLILDQFEELFTRVREKSPDDEESFIVDLANVVRRRLPAEVEQARAKELETIEEALGEERDQGRVAQLKNRRHELVSLLYDTVVPDVKVLIALREDYLADLERLRERIPAVFHKMMRLDPLTKLNAQDAIEKPATRDDIPGKDVFHFERDPAKKIDTVDQIIQFLEMRKVERRTREEATIDPGQLQLICQRVDANRTGDVVTAKALGGEKGMQRILQRFYRDTLHSIPGLRIGRSAQRWRPSMTNFLIVNRPRAAARRLCEHGLISRGGHRDSLSQEAIHSRFGVIDDDLKTLEREKLIRSTTRLERSFYELSHDTLIKPVRALAASRRSAYYVAAYLLACTIPFVAVRYGSDWNESRLNQNFAAKVKSRQVNFAGANLSNRTLRQAVWTGGSLARASLRDVTFEKVRFEQTDFRDADVSGARFDGCAFYRCQLLIDGNAPSFVGSSMFLSDLSGAKIPLADFSQTSFSGSNLSNANLDGAKIVDADFRLRTLVTGISVRDADFSGTAWWLASGWSAEQLRDLSTRFPPNDSIVNSKLYKDAMSKFESQLLGADSVNQAETYGQRAWFRAVRGVELREALSDVQQALYVRQEPDPDVLDTRGYIRLQMRDVAGALADCKKAAQGGAVGENLYHLALAELAAGDAASAAGHFRDSMARGYQPTYELVLTPRKGR